MERLTKRVEIDKCPGIWVKEKIGLRTWFNYYDEGYLAISKCAEYEDLEEQGLLLKLPCKVGDTVYILAGRFGTFYEEDICDGFYIGSNGILQIKVQSYKGNHGTYGILGETVFLSKTEAEEALRRMEGENETD